MEEVLERGVQTAKELEARGVECIISRGATGILIKNIVSTPVVLVQITTFDILNALFQAKDMGKKLAFFEHIQRKSYYDFDQIIRILNLPPHTVRVFYYKDLESLECKIQEAADWQADVAVSTGQCTLQMAEDKGIPNGVMVYSSREAIVDAFQRARDVVVVRQQERKAAEFMNTIIDNVDTGLIVLNDQMAVSHFNPISEKLLGYKKERIIGHKVTDMHDMNQQLIDFLRMDKQPSSQMLDVGEKKIYATRIPLEITENNFKKLFAVIVTLQEVGKIQKIEAKIRKELYAKGLVARYKFNDIVCRSKIMKDAVNRAKRFARNDSTVLITGESGTGKELFAHSIHNESPRNDGPFVAVNCATIPENLLESELFGYSDGAFTGAKKGGKPGLFELAHGGTIFLDEISEMPLSLQANLLRVLQEKVVRRVGDDKIIPVNVRIIAATNRDLSTLVKENQFRQDLFFRLNVLSLHLPPLRDRKEDIFLLIKHYVKNSGSNNILKTLEEYKKWIEQYNWPGNARELENFVEKCLTLSEGINDPSITIRELVDELYSFGTEYLTEEELALDANKLLINIGTMEEMEKEILTKIQKLYPSDNKSTIAKRLNVSRTTLWKKLKSFEEEATSFR